MALSALQEQIITALSENPDARIIRHSNYHAIHASKAGRSEMIRPDHPAWALPGYTVRTLVRRDLLQIGSKSHSYAVLELSPLGKTAATLIRNRTRHKPRSNP